MPEKKQSGMKDKYFPKGMRIGLCYSGTGIGGCKMKEAREEDIAKVMEILEQFSETGTSRMKLQVSEEKEDGTVDRQYHHGRCDVGSPWAKGAWFDVLE